MDTSCCGCHYCSTDLQCYHCWQKERSFTTWASSGVETEIPSWAVWYTDYRCVICNELVTLPSGQQPQGGFVVLPSDEDI